ncbi:hypothetical protein [Agrobacterium sp. LAD9]|uniref:hypothetical protein n=1 Tax=Agrobacterium sp. LAD9 TaxID=2055153 RepID=UPI000D1E02B1|nr:hypothetical protein [Agrobacterium sp. LAD9]
MEKNRKFRLSQHEDGNWNVIDTSTGGPVEVSINGSFYVLYKMPKDDAEKWLLLLSDLPQSQKQ